MTILDPKNPNQGTTDRKLKACSQFFYGAEMQKVIDLYESIEGIVESQETVLQVAFASACKTSNFDFGRLRRLIGAALAFKQGQASSSAGDATMDF